MTRLERYRIANGYPEWMVKAIVKAGGSVNRWADKRKAKEAIIRSVIRCETHKHLAEMLVRKHVK